MGKAAFNEAKFYQIFRKTPIAMALVSPEKHLILDVNDSFEGLFGYDRGGLCGLSFIEAQFWGPDRNAGELLESIARPGRAGKEECEYRKPDGTPGVCSIYGRKIELEQEAFLLYCIVEHNEQTGLYNTADEQTARHLERQDRLALVEEMAASFGHEIRNPVTSVRGFLQLISTYEATQPYREHFELMIEELDRANEIITSFLSMASHKSLELRLQSLSELVAAIYPLILSDAISADKNVCLELNSDEPVEINHNEIRQLVLNLARNGLEAMPPRGTLTIGTYRDGLEVVLFVKDQGQGLPPQVINGLGTPFLTTKESGTGLGLAVCYSIVARHKASLDLTTGPQGTTFNVRFKTFVEGARWD